MQAPSSCLILLDVNKIVVSLVSGKTAFTLSNGANILFAYCLWHVTCAIIRNKRYPMPIRHAFRQSFG